MDKLPDLLAQFPEWYQAVIAQADFIDNSPTKGCFIIKPYGYALWENIQAIVDKKIKAEGVQNTYFPMLIPEEFLKREAKHVEGFAPEVAVVTHAGGKALEEPYVVRPTSETIIYDAFARWIKSWRDLPLKINQWTNVIRWEMRTRAFLRTTEFLWQEGHTAHATLEEARNMALTMLEHYRDLAERYLAIPVIIGAKSPNERFPGADVTYTFEGLMQDGKALQMGTSHILSQQFPASFGVQFQAKDGTLQTPFCTSWAVTTRLIGALIMTHGDQQGIIIPPMIAPIQVVMVPIYKSDEERVAVLAKMQEVESQLKAAGVRTHLDADDQKTPGAKFFTWEVRGVPLRLEIGPKDLQNGSCVLVNRVEQEKERKKSFIKLDNLVSEVNGALATIQSTLFERAKAKRTSQWHQGEKLAQFGKTLDEKQGIYQTGWCGNDACELKLKDFKGSIRCIIDERKHDFCFNCDAASAHEVLVAKSY